MMVSRRLPLDNEILEYWKNDERLDVFFAPFRNRGVNPIDWETKLDFWKRAIQNYCIERDVCTFKLETLVQGFMRNLRSPAGLRIVLEEMNKNREIVAVDEFFKKNSKTWTGWAADVLIKKPSFWLLNNMKNVVSPVDIGEINFVHLATVKGNAKQLLKDFPEESKNKALDEHEINRVLKDAVNLKFSLQLLESTGKISVKQVSKNGTNINLYKFNSENVKLTEINEIEVNIYFLTATERFLTETIEQIETEYLNQELKAKEFLSKRHKEMAKICLRKRSDANKRLESRRNALHNIQILLGRLESVGTDAEVIASYEHALEALKNNFKNTKINEDSVMDIMEEIGEMVETQNNIESALAGPIDDIEIDLEAELAELESFDRSISLNPNETDLPKESKLPKVTELIQETELIKETELNKKTKETDLSTEESTKPKEEVKNLNLPDAPITEPTVENMLPSEIR